VVAIEQPSLALNESFECRLAFVKPIEAKILALAPKQIESTKTRFTASE
jgi:hypothetical protein